MWDEDKELSGSGGIQEQAAKEIMIESFGVVDPMLDICSVRLCRGSYSPGLLAGDTGGTHHWAYDIGQWNERKEEPDLWKVWSLLSELSTYRHHLAIEEYANMYSTRMEGHKYKREREVQLLEDSKLCILGLKNPASLETRQFVDPTEIAYVV
ncbi:hypothetical protein DFH29DRAFT_1066595 [Suillus ampliporus]|nr:hypothetical protein DFH29DRAFT_1066595 [Suillus ampliporus]